MKKEGLMNKKVLLIVVENVIIIRTFITIPLGTKEVKLEY